MIGADDLDLQALDGVGEDPVDFLGLAARDAGNFGGVAHHAGDAAFGIFQDAVGAAEDRIDAALQVGREPREMLQGFFDLQHHDHHDRHLHDDGDGRDHDKGFDPTGHSAPELRAMFRCRRANANDYDARDSRL